MLDKRLEMENPRSKGFERSSEEAVYDHSTGDQA